MSVYEKFGECYYDSFLDYVFDQNGVFGGENIRAFIRTLHGDNDYEYNFSQDEDDLLMSNVNLVATSLNKALSKNFKEWRKRNSYYANEIGFLENVKVSFQRISR